MKIIISFLFFFGTIVHQGDAQTVPTNPKANVSLSSRGRRPETSGCSDGGLTCPQSISLMSAAQSRSANLTTTPYMSVEASGHLIWYIPKNYLPFEMETLTFYKKQAFFVEEPFLLDSAVAEQLQLEKTTSPNPIRILAGMYPIIELPEGYIVRF